MELQGRDTFKIAFLDACCEAGLTPAEMLEAAEGIHKAASEGRFVVQAHPDAASAKKAAVRDLTLSKAASSSVLGTLGWAGGQAVDAGKSLAGGLLGYGLPLAAVAPPILGAAAGYGLAKLTDVDQVDVKDVRNRETIEDLERETRSLRREQANRKYREALRGRPARPML